MDDQPLTTAAPPARGQARAHILQTAHDLFYQHGIRATGVDTVIAAAKVTKVTFYRHFPSKDALVMAYLAHRHARWMAWFRASLARRGGNVPGLWQTLGEWCRDPNFRGCAFINVVGELGGSLPEAVALSRQHKDEVIEVIAALLPASPQRRTHALALTLLMEGAIVQAQMGLPWRRIAPALKQAGMALFEGAALASRPEA
jgi:AcrR family transcriptional regulator